MVVNNIITTMAYNESLVLTPVKNAYHYNRSFSEPQERLTQTLKTQYNAEHVIVTNSGMNAISSLVHGIICDKKCDIVYSNELYCDTPRLFKYLLKHNDNIESLHEIDVRENDNIISTFSKLKDKNVILHIESCSNPNGYILDYSVLDIIKDIPKNLYVIIDNTWLTHVVFNPLTINIDNLFVVTSLTKYYSAGTAIGGAIISNNKQVMDAAHEWVRITGIHTSPHNCDLINNNAQTIEDRIRASSSLTTMIVNYLKSNPKVYKVSYPNLFNNNLGPSVLTFYVKSSKSKVLKALSLCKSIEHKTSFGSQYSRTDPQQSIGHLL